MSQAHERPTLEAVARRAGVSRATVSRVVNGSTTVAEPIRDAVRRAVEELGYVPNQAARSLVTQRTDSIALILPETRHPGLLRRPVLPGHHPRRQPGARGRRQAARADDGRLVASHDRVERYAIGRPRRRRAVRLDARRRPAARPRWPGWASRWCAAAARWAAPSVPVRRRRPRRRRRAAVRHLLDTGRAADRHHRRPAGHGRRHRPARPATGPSCAGRTGARSWRSATSPASPARPRCASCWTTTRSSTRSSSPPT